jgi:Na+/proline symporter
MHAVDWAIIFAYFAAITAIGVVFKKRAEGGVEDFFLSGRRLPWWLAGTSLVATSFSSDTPLFVTGLVRKNGISGNWHWWFMALASIASLFFFARLCPGVQSPDILSVNALGWASGVLFILGMTIAAGKLLLGSVHHAIFAASAALAGLIGVLISIRRMRWE